MNNFPRTGIHCEKNSDKVYRDRMDSLKDCNRRLLRMREEMGIFKHSYLHIYYSIAYTVMLWHTYSLYFAHIFSIYTGKHLMYLLLSFQCLAEKITYGRCAMNEWVSFLSMGLIWENSKILSMKAFFIFQNVVGMCCVVFLLQWFGQEVSKAVTEEDWSTLIRERL